MLKEDYKQALLRIEQLSKEREYAANLNLKYLRESSELRSVLDSYEDLVNRLAK